MYKNATIVSLFLVSMAVSGCMSNAMRSTLKLPLKGDQRPPAVANLDNRQSSEQPVADERYAHMYQQNPNAQAAFQTQLALAKAKQPLIDQSKVGVDLAKKTFGVAPVNGKQVAQMSQPAIPTKPSLTQTKPEPPKFAAQPNTQPVAPAQFGAPTQQQVPRGFTIPPAEAPFVENALALKNAKNNPKIEIPSFEGAGPDVPVVEKSPSPETSKPQAVAVNTQAVAAKSQAVAAKSIAMAPTQKATKISDSASSVDEILQQSAQPTSTVKPPAGIPAYSKTEIAQTEATDKMPIEKLQNSAEMKIAATTATAPSSPSDSVASNGAQFPVVSASNDKTLSSFKLPNATVEPENVSQKTMAPTAPVIEIVMKGDTQAGSFDPTTPPLKQPVAATTLAATTPAAKAVAQAVAPAVVAPQAAGKSSKDWKLEINEAITALQSHLYESDLSEKEQTQIQLRLRLLHLVGDNPERAVEKILELDSHRQEFWRDQLAALNLLLTDPMVEKASAEGQASSVVLATRSGSDSETQSATHAIAQQATPKQDVDSVEALRKAVKGLDSITPLNVANVAICTEISGFGNVKKFASNQFQKDSQTLIYCEIENYIDTIIGSGADQRHEVKLQANWEMLNEKNQVVFKSNFPVITDHSIERRKDFYLHLPMTVPDLTAGKYQLRIVVKDVHGKKEGYSQLVQFQIQ